MSDICGDNRFELIEKYKKKLIEATNIETATDEMAVLDNILFRIWQMGWLDKLELPSAQPETPPYVAEIESEYKKWVKMPHINKPLAKALYEVWKKHDREDVSRNGRFDQQKSGKRYKDS